MCWEKKLRSVFKQFAIDPFLKFQFFFQLHFFVFVAFFPFIVNTHFLFLLIWVSLTFFYHFFLNNDFSMLVNTKIDFSTYSFFGHLYETLSFYFMKHQISTIILFYLKIHSLHSIFELVFFLLSILLFS